MVIDPRDFSIGPWLEMPPPGTDTVRDTSVAANIATEAGTSIATGTVTSAATGSPLASASVEPTVAVSTNWILIAAVAAAAYFLFKGGK
jgi:hypothetical protein